MEDLQLNVEAVIQKWSSHHAGPTVVAKDEKTWYKNHSTMGEDVSSIHRKRSRKLLKSKVRDERTLAVEEALQIQRRFKLTPPVLQNPFQEHHTYFCKKCQNVLEFVKQNSNTKTKSQPLHLMEHITTKTRNTLLSMVAPSLSFAFSKSVKNDAKKKTQTKEDAPSPGLCRFLTRKILGYLQMSFTSQCFQSKDEVNLNMLRENDYPLIFSHNCKDVLMTLLLHLYLICIDVKGPLTVVKDSTVTSSFTKCILRKIGFVFLNEDDVSEAKEITTQLLNNLETNGSVMILSSGYKLIKSTTKIDIIDEIIQAQRVNDKRLSRAVLIVASLSSEMESNKSRSFSFVDLLRLAVSPKKYGLLQLNLSQPVKFKSIVKIAGELNHQDSCDEENNLISRHLNFDFQETGVLLPINIIAFLFLTKYRSEKTVDISDLISQTEKLILQLKSQDKYIGFTGSTDSIAWHALHLMAVQGLLQLDLITKTAILLFNNKCTAFKISKHASKVLHIWIPRAILAASIISSCGGEHALHQGNGDNLTFTGSLVLEKAEFLAEMISFLVDFHCSFNVMTDSLTSALDQFVTMDILKTNESCYEDVFHRRLANNLNMEFEREDETDGQNDEKSYQVIYTEEGICELQYFAGCVKPLIYLCYTLLAIIREEMEEKKFSVNDLFVALQERNEKQLFPYGEMVTLEFTSRFCDYLFESEVIDDEKETYCVSENFCNNDRLVQLLYRISELR